MCDHHPQTTHPPKHQPYIVAQVQASVWSRCVFIIKFTTKKTYNFPIFYVPIRSLSLYIYISFTNRARRLLLSVYSRWSEGILYRLFWTYVHVRRSEVGSGVWGPEKRLGGTVTVFKKKQHQQIQTFRTEYRHFHATTKPNHSTSTPLISYNSVYI